jgi:site-specific DNA recombinase
MPPEAPEPLTMFDNLAVRRRTRRPPTEHVTLDGVAPALISPEFAAAANARLARNKIEASRNNRNPEATLLRAGIAVCGYCGCNLQAITHRTNGTFYRCGQTNRDAHGCPGFSIMASILDAAVWDGVRDRLLDRDLIRRELDRLRREDPTKADAAAIARRLGEIERKQTNLRRELAAEDNADVAALIRADLAALAVAKRQLDHERDELSRQRTAWEDAQQRLADLDQWIATVSANLADADYQTKRLALSACRVLVCVWATDHTPRWQATMQLGQGAAFDIVATTGRCCTRCSRR